MRWLEILEAPLVDFDYVPPPEVPKRGTRAFMNVDHADHGLLTSEKGVAKIHNAFERTPFKFNIYVVPNKKGTQTQLSDVEQMIGRSVETAGRITVFYTHNLTAPFGRMPMNAWTLAHRMAHAMQAEKNHLSEKVIWQTLVDLWNMARADTAPEAKFVGQWLDMGHPESVLTGFSNVLFTMRSAREGLIHNPLDVAGEPLAQYLLTGRVRFARSAEWDVSRPKRTDFNGSMIADRRDHSAINVRIQRTEREVSDACEAQLQELVGKVISF